MENKDIYKDNQDEGMRRTRMPLQKANFVAMAVAGAMIVIGFLLMLGGSSTVEEFNPDIFSTRRIVVGPCIAFLGFVAMAVAIIIDPAKLEKFKKSK